MKTPIYTHGEIGALSLIANDPAILGTQVWESDYFAIETHKRLFQALQSSFHKTGDASEFSAVAELEKSGYLHKMGGEDAVHKILSAHYVKPGDVAKQMAHDYRKELIRYKGYRDTLKLIEESVPDIENANANLRDLGDKIANSLNDNAPTQTSVKEIANNLIDIMEGKEDRKCYPTGLVYLDRTMKGGMHGGELLTIAAESGGGKSIFMVQAALANLQAGNPVVYFSLEMDKTDVFERMVAATARIPVRTSEEYKTGHIRELPAISNAIFSLQKLPLTIVDDMFTLDEICAEAQRLSMLGKASVVLVDYLQIVENEGDNREQAVSDIARRFKNLASRIKAPVITGSQLNDDGKLRESRAIKQHSNQVIYIKHKEAKSCVYVDKNRRGPRAYQFDIKMDGEISRLTE